MRWTGHLQCMGEMRNAYKNLIGKPEYKSFGRPKYGREDSNQTDLK